MNVRSIRIGLLKHCLAEDWDEDYDKLKNWCSNNLPYNYSLDWNNNADGPYQLFLDVANLPEKWCSYILLSLPKSTLIEKVEFNIHNDVEHLFDFGDEE
jgi:hypothetical protein